MSDTYVRSTLCFIILFFVTDTERGTMYMYTCWNVDMLYDGQINRKRRGKFDEFKIFCWFVLFTNKRPFDITKNNSLCWFSKQLQNYRITYRNKERKYKNLQISTIQQNKISFVYYLHFMYQYPSSSCLNIDNAPSLILIESKL